MAKTNFFLELLLGTVTGALTTVGESKLEEALQKLHDQDPESYKVALSAGKLFVSKIKPLVEKSATKIDDAVLSALGQAIDDSAKANNVEL